MKQLFSSICRYLWIPSSRNPAGITAVQAFPSLLILAVLAYWWYTYSGPYRWLAELQLHFFGSFDIVITLLATVALLLAPMTLLGILIENNGWLPESNSTTSTAHYEVPVGIMTLSVMALVLAWFTYQRVPRGQAVELTLAEVAASESMPSHVLLHGHALTESSFQLDSDHGNYDYTPLVSATYTIGDPVLVYIESCTPRDDASLTSTEHKGVLIENGLPGLIRESFQSSQAPPEQRHIVLVYSDSMQGIKHLPTALFSGGILLGLISAVMFFIRWRETVTTQNATHSHRLYGENTGK